MAHPMDRLPAGSPIGANAACRGGQQAVTRHKTGVVSRVHSGSRNAKAFGTGRNTDQTDYTPATTNPNCSQGQPTEPTTETDSSNRTSNLNYVLKQLRRRNRDGSYATQRDRVGVLGLAASQLHEPVVADQERTSYADAGVIKRRRPPVPSS
jgi:hypothetical protein